MKIVFLEADTLGTDTDLSMFDGLGEVIRYGLSDPARNAERIREADILVVNKVPMNESTLRDAGNLKAKEGPSIAEHAVVGPIRSPGANSCDRHIVNYPHNNRENRQCSPPVGNNPVNFI